ncbi:glucans biosynthesis glucosyltransferase MdoH [Yoonia sediminilitoris]|uniref:Glucans biosynthesis glucosyltransferase H n=1 Tax=Yoonia sediminilitoris TaxID=1286148 RepID=A0A2T6KJX1_9RHOB|nr:glucans biosynthesis glucosyltransferase MdoH [Yoonia sediminilitoris]PUB16253.1 membrane glycosyltransferase [Yoonia sediminilitoris]RCW96602.1 membrane glycosyltransferase [Yoonia sediminilitoris]
MDGVKPPDMMPPQVPLARPIQALNKPHKDQTAPGSVDRTTTFWWRIFAFLPAFAVTTAVVTMIVNWFAMAGLYPVEIAIIALITVTFFWVALSVSTSVVGVSSLFLGKGRTPKAHDPAPQKVALLVPVYNEVPTDVFGNAAAMMRTLIERDGGHDFSLFILSDTRGDAAAALEERAFLNLQARLPLGAHIYYRRRIENTDRKVGNLADWVERWGGAYDAMLVLDADSLMSGEAILAMTDALAEDPAAGLIQSFPTIFGARTVFARLQQFSNRVYGAPLAEGLSRWTDQDGNYWGHNAIIRTRAFAACAGLPKSGKGELILSHDFVEASLLRRAGWAVRFLPGVQGSYEEVPATLIDYVLRDRRWCQGNLQHLGLLRARGFHALSRFHLISGAMGYLMSPAWFTLLIIWALVGNGDEANVVKYFSGYNSQVNWPTMSTGNSMAILGFMYAMLIAPKILGAGVIHKSGLRLRDMGGIWQFLTSMSLEIALSIAYAPVLMVQQTKAVVAKCIGRKVGWNPQNRQGGHYSLAVMAKFHAVETFLGACALFGMAAGLMSLWLLPIALSLAFAVPLSWLSGVDLSKRRWSARHMGTPEIINAPPIIRRAMAERRRAAATLEAQARIAAE